MRVHELAKATNIESKDVLAIAKKHKVGVKQSPSANIEDKDIRKLMPLIAKFKDEQKVKDEAAAKKKAEEQKKKDDERRRKEDERRREVDEKRRAEEDTRRAAEEEERRKVVEESARRQAAELEKQRAADEARRKAEADAAPAKISGPILQAGLGKGIATPQGRPAAAPLREPGPQAPRPAAPRPPAGPRPAQGQPQGPQQGQAPGQAQGQGGAHRYAPTFNRPANPGGPRPQQGGQGFENRGPRPQGQYGDRPPRPQGQYGDRPPRPPGQYDNRGPRPGGGQFENRGPRPGGPGGPGGQRFGDRPPRPQGQFGDRPPRPGGGQFENRGPRPGGPGGPGGQRFGDRPPRPGGAPGMPRRDESGGGPQRPVRLTEGNLPTIGVMRDNARPARRGPDAKKGERRPAGTEAEKKKAQVLGEKKRMKPSRIFELDGMQPASKVPGRPAPGGRRMPGGRGGGRRKSGGYNAPRELVPTSGATIFGEVTVAQFAEKINVSQMDLLKRLLLAGEMLTLNHTMSYELMELMAGEYGVDVEIVPDTDEGDLGETMQVETEENMIRRPPVVTIMGHVDHGKTTLLDRVRKSNVVEGEFGGITQHIGAYHVETAKGNIVFLDTPGHEAFTAMRARGAKATDLVILVVAADDGFMPQTIEALQHAQAAKVPVVVAINKVDKAGADPNKIKQEALQYSLVPEEFGGDTIFVEISAKQNINLDALLEMVALQAEILDLKADPTIRAQGIVVESHVDPARGAVATILVQRGTLRAGDNFVCGDISGSVRAMNDDRGKPIEEAGPSMPVEILGLEGAPPAGEQFLVMPSERVAREVAEKREFRRRLAGLAPVKKHISIDGLHDVIAEGKVKELNLILKADVQGSIEAISQGLSKMNTGEVRFKLLRAAVGGITESDVNLADASDAIIIGFNVRPEPGATQLAEREGVQIRTYRIIYELFEELRKGLEGLLEPKFEEKILGHAEIRQIFKISRIGTVAGCFVTDGEITRDASVRILRDNVIAYDGKLSSLKRFKDDVKRVTESQDCGLSIENYNDLKDGDVLEFYTMQSVAVSLESSAAQTGGGS